LRPVCTVKIYMLNAFVFLNCDVDTEPIIINEINDISGVSEAMELIGVYDIVAKLSEESREDIAKSVRKIHAIANVRSSLTMIVAEKDYSVKQIEEETVAQ
jgi:DNA-binding Lrp family transcriptional regulator